MRISRKKSLAKKRNKRTRRLKLLVPTRRNSILFPNPATWIACEVRCVSKLWSSIITSQDFKNQFNITTYSAPPRILISFRDSDRDEIDTNKLLLVSSPNPNPSSSSKSCLVPYKDLSLFKICGKDVHNSVRGLVCVGSRLKVGICNPSTKQLDTFPYIRFSREVCPCRKYFFGYDPIEDQYKILANDLRWRSENKIVVLGREKVWREAPCVAYPHRACTRGLYMNGTIYYGASRKDIDSIIVSFDVRSETFNVNKVPNNVLPEGYNMWLATPWVLISDKTLIHYEGKIGVVEKPRSDGSFRLWVVEDAAKEEWSMNTFHLPRSYAGLDFFNVMDTTFYNGEICLVPKKLYDPFRLFYYNLKKNSMRDVVIEGLPVSELKRVKNLDVTVSDHCESFMLLEDTKKHHGHELYVIRRN